MLPVTEVAYAGTLQNRACFNGETGWLRNLISVPGRGRIFFIQKHFKPRGKDLKPEKYTKGERV